MLRDLAHVRTLVHAVVEMTSCLFQQLTETHVAVKSIE